MAVGKKIQKVLDITEWDNGWGPVELISAGLKYVTFFIRGDWKHAHLHFERLLTANAKKLGYTCTLVESKAFGDNGTDFYSAETKFKIE